MKFLLFVAVAMSLPGMAFALAGLKMGTELKSFAAPAPVSGCTDFSGTWKGQCSANGQTSQPQSITVTQSGCTLLEEGNELIPIGGVKEEFVLIPDIPGAAPVSSNSTITYDWDANKVNLNVHLMALTREVDKGDLFSGDFTGQYSIQNKQLVETLQGTNLKVSCVYDKQ